MNCLELMSLLRVMVIVVFFSVLTHYYHHRHFGKERRVINDNIIPESSFL